MIPKEIEEASITFLLSQLVVSPLYILMVILSILYLVTFWRDTGCLTSIGKVGSVFYISIYLIALYFYFS